MEYMQANINIIKHKISKDTWKYGSCEKRENTASIFCYGSSLLSINTIILVKESYILCTTTRRLEQLLVCYFMIYTCRDLAFEVKSLILIPMYISIIRDRYEKQYKGLLYISFSVLDWNYIQITQQFITCNPNCRYPAYH